MKSYTKTTIKKFQKALLIGVAVIFLVAAYAITAHAVKLWPFNNSTLPPTTQPTNTSPTQTQSTSTTDTTGNTPAKSTTNTAKNPQTAAPSTSSSGGISITTKQQSGDTLQIRGLITGTENSGTCTLKLTNGSSTPITMTSGIQAGPSTSTCQGFDVSISGQNIFPGTWDITLSYTSGTLNGSATDQVVIK